jgi:hypothetical protein
LRAINLQMITTALSHGRPYRLPFEDRRFAFRETELRDYFSDDVVDYLVQHARKDDESVAAMNDPDLHALPEPWDLPIVVAARMSLSFPILFSLVPLHAVDYSRKINAKGAQQFDRCWFIDGGLSSNFPTNLFDSPFPRWPTFGINLDAFHPDYPKDETNEDKNVHMIGSAGAGISEHWLRFDSFAAYIAAMLDTIRNWRDNAQLAVPGFRDRVVHVKLSPDEGGLNLNMNAAKVTALSERGMWAGRLLRARYGLAGATSDPLNWNSHRWTRFRTSMQLLQKALRQMTNAFTYKDPAYPGYEELLARHKDEQPKTGYWWPRDANAYRTATEELRKDAESLANGADFNDGAPKPSPELRISPRL